MQNIRYDLLHKNRITELLLKSLSGKPLSMITVNKITRRSLRPTLGKD